MRNVLIFLLAIISSKFLANSLRISTGLDSVVVMMLNFCIQYPHLLLIHSSWKINDDRREI